MASSSSSPRPPGKRAFVPPVSTAKPLGRLGGYKAPDTGQAAKQTEETPPFDKNRPPRQEMYTLRDILCAIHEPRETPQQSVPPPSSNQQGRPPADHRQQTADALLEHIRHGNARAVFKWLVPSTHAAVAAAEAEAAAAAPTATAIEKEMAARHNSTSPLAQEESLRFDIAAQLPPLLFSEFLRCVDPYVVYAHCDAAQQIAITAGMAQFTPLARQVDQYGRRTVYVALLRALVSIFRIRRAVVRDLVEAGRPPHPGQLAPTPTPPVVGDYVVLLRAAGAASDMPMAKRVWHEMEGMGLVADRQGSVYAELVRARFLTERLYTQHDPQRLRVRPVNLHRQKTYVAARALHVLDRLRLARERHKQHRFGQNPHRPHTAEHLTRTLRKTRPLARILRKASRLGYAASNERLLAAAIIAHGRSGSAVAIYALLQRAWGIIVQEKTDGDGDGNGKGNGNIAVHGGYYYAPDSQMRPTAVLLDALVQSLCGMARVTCALRLVEHVARRYAIAVPDQVWFDLLGWAYAMTTKPVAAEWATAGLPVQVDEEENTVMYIWQTMTSAPFFVEPGFDQYGVLIKTLIHAGHAGALDQALALLRRVRDELFDAQLREHERALMAYAETARQNVQLERAVGTITRTQKRSPPGLVHRVTYTRHRYRALDMGPVTARLERAASLKWHMWYSLQTWCWALFKQLQDYKVKPERGTKKRKNRNKREPAADSQRWYETLAQPLVQTWRTAAAATAATATAPPEDVRFDDPFLVRTVPDIVLEFRPFLFSGYSVVNNGRVIGSAVEYSIVSGTVHLREPRAYYYYYNSHAGHQHHAKFVRTQQTVDLPALRPHVNFTLQKKMARARHRAAQEQLELYGGYGHGRGEVRGDGCESVGEVSSYTDFVGRVDDDDDDEGEGDYNERTTPDAGNAKQMLRDSKSSHIVVVARLDEGYCVVAAPVTVDDACCYDTFDAVCRRVFVSGVSVSGINDDISTPATTARPTVPPGPPPRDVIVTNKAGHEVVLEQEHGMHLFISEGRRWNDRLYMRTLMRRRTIWVRRPVVHKVDLQKLGRATPRDWLVREFA